jgi:hypothetical protein
MVHRLVGAALEDKQIDALKAARDTDDAPIMDNSFVVTDGGKSYTVTMIDIGRGKQPLLMFLDDIPPRNSDLWIVHHTLGTFATSADESPSQRVICFTPGTRIRTPDGFSLIEDLREGDYVQTKDNGAQCLEWIGSRRMTGARLFALPQLRPIRFSMGALSSEMPDGDLLVSPEHRILLQGDVARQLFNTPEVLVNARDLINGETIRIDRQVREVTYIHVMFAQHQVLWANNVETESFHPASAPMATLDSDDRARLLGQFPELEFDPHTYGSFARRSLSASEAAILRHAA